MTIHHDLPRLSSMRDRLVTRCTFCGDWRYGSRDCDTCGTQPAVGDDVPRRPNVGKRWAS